MADFTVRVELHGAEWEDYDILHEEMEAQGFSRTIRGESGDLFELPPAEFTFEPRRFPAEQLIDEEAAQRVEDWIAAARKAGARKLAGGPRDGEDRGVEVERDAH